MIISLLTALMLLYAQAVLALDPPAQLATGTVSCEEISLNSTSLEPVKMVYPVELWLLTTGIVVLDRWGEGLDVEYAGIEFPSDMCSRDYLRFPEYFYIADPYEGGADERYYSETARWDFKLNFGKQTLTAQGRSIVVMYHWFGQESLLANCSWKLSGPCVE